MKNLLEIVIVFATSFSIISVAVIAATSNINILTPTASQTFNAGDPVTVSGQVNLLSGDTDPTKYGVTINWGDGTITDCLPLSGVSNPFTYTTSPSNNHAYSSAASITITALLFHQCTHGQDPSKATATANVAITIVNTCTLSASPNPNFGSLNPGDNSLTDQKTTITNTGSINTTSLTIQGTNWSDGGSNSMYVGQTRWSLSPGQIYNSGMTNVTASPVSLGQNVGPATPLDIFLKLRIPAHQVNAVYTQTLTFTGGC